MSKHLVFDGYPHADDFVHTALLKDDASVSEEAGRPQAVETM